MNRKTRFLKMITFGLAITLGLMVVGTTTTAQAQGALDMQRQRGAIVNLVRIIGVEVVKATELTYVQLLEELGQDKTLAEIVTAHGADVAQVKAASKAVATEAINSAVKNGKLTQAEADKMLTGLDKAIDQAFETSRSELGDRARIAVNVLRITLKEVSDATGTTAAELLREMAGTQQTLTDYVTAHNGDVSKIKADVKTALTEEANKLLANGKVTQEQLNTFLVNLDDTLNRIFTRHCRVTWGRATP